MTGTIETFLPVLTLLFAVVRGMQPPHIYNQSKNDMIYIHRDMIITLPCDASGRPAPRYKWTVNGQDIQGLKHIEYIKHQLIDHGTLEIHVRRFDMTGIYQCFATNKHGTSVSNKVQLRNAVFGEFHDVVPLQEFVEAGVSRTLPCISPRSIPAPDLQWIQLAEDGTETNVKDLFSPEDFAISNYTGDLHFRSLQHRHDSTGKPYVCVVTNSLLGQRRFGKKYTLSISGEPKPHPINLMDVSPSEITTFKGDTLKLECIFGGNPLPVVSWERSVQELPDKAILSEDNSTLIIPNVQFQDSLHTYSCFGTIPQAIYSEQRSFTISFKERPTWTQHLSSTRVIEGDTASFTCWASAQPTPKYHWFINGKKIQDVRDTRIDQNPRVSLTEVHRYSKLMIANVTKEDGLVVQCNATNKYGSLWGDAYLAVGEELTSHGETLYLTINALLINLMVGACLLKSVL